MSSTSIRGRARWTAATVVAAGIGALILSAPAQAADPHAASSPADDLILRAGEEGTAFRSLTVEGEDRIHVEYERPALSLELAPETAPGLDLGTVEDVLNRSIPDLGAPLLAVSAGLRTPYLGRPWLTEFTTGPLAVFRPAVDGAERWRLEIVDGGGEAVAVYEGSKRPPATIPWDGRTKDAGGAVPGRTYSYVFTVHDRAGNKRTFVGDGFEVPAYRREVTGRPVLAFPGSAMAAASTDWSRPPIAPGAAAMPPILLEAASWINQRSAVGQVFRVTATARTGEGASALAARATEILAGLVPGGQARFESAIQVAADAPAAGVVLIAPASAGRGPATPTPRAR
jgi:hypothetical protein